MEVPSSPRVPAGRTRSILINLGIAGGSLAIGAALAWPIATMIRFIAAYWHWIVDAIVVLIVLAALGLVAAGIEAHKAHVHEQRLRELAYLDRVDAMTGRQFEELVADLLRRDGYRHVSIVGRSADRGVDITGRTPDGRKIAVQCKRQSRTVGADRVRNLIGAVHSTYTGHVGVLVTSNIFTAPAVNECGDRLVLIDRDRLARWMDGDALII